MIRRSTDSIANLASAMVQAAQELTDIKRGGSASIPTKSGGSYSYKYATLPDILQTARPILARHGLVVIQNASEGHGESVDISTMIIHSSGEYLVLDSLPMPMGHTAQETGSAITYGRRYQLLAALGLAADDDDDGASAAPRSTQSRATSTGPRPVTEAQKNALIRMASERGLALPDFSTLTAGEASRLFDEWKAKPKLEKGDKLSKADDEELRKADQYDEEPF
jgi:hypothetical protein